MFWLMFVSMALAAVFGFFLGIYYFLYRTKIPRVLSWLLGVISGSIMGGFMAGAAFFALWPPVNIVFMFILLILALIVTFVSLKGGNARFNEAEIWGEDNGGLDPCSLDLDLTPGA